MGECPNCKSSNMVYMADLTFLAPFDMYHNVTKKGITRKEFEMWGITWANAWVNCRNCGWQRHPIYEPGRAKRVYEKAKDLCESLAEGLILSHDSEEKYSLLLDAIKAYEAGEWSETPGKLDMKKE